MPNEVWMAGSQTAHANADCYHTNKDCPRLRGDPKQHPRESVADFYDECAWCRGDVDPGGPGTSYHDTLEAATPNAVPGPYQIPPETEERVYTAIIEALDAGDVGLGGFPTTADITARTDITQESVRKAAHNLEARGRIEIGETLVAVDKVGSSTNSYIPQEGDR